MKHLQCSSGVEPVAQLETNRIIPGDCLKVLPTLPDDSVDFIFTSPPYGDRQKKFRMYQEAVMRPMGSWKEPRLVHLGVNDVIRHESRVESGLGRRVANWVGRDLAYPTNVLYLPTESSNKEHSAAFPSALPT